MKPNRGGHLIERAAALLRSGAGLSAATDADLAVAMRAAATADAVPPAAAPPTVAPPPVTAPPVAAPAIATPAIATPAIATPAIATPAGPARLELETLKRVGLMLGGRERTRISEELRITVSRILRSLRTGKARMEPSNLLMVTSAKPGEGKSFTALNLAASIAQNGLGEVLLVDCDAKPRSLSGLLGLADAPGLYNLVSNPALRIEDTLIRTAISTLSYLPVGARDAAAAPELGMTRPVSSAIERLRRRFAHHFIILDCAPCLSTSDPSMLAALVDQVVMVVEAERTQRSEIEASLELVRACPNITLVLNKVRLTTSSTFGAYYYYGSNYYGPTP